MRLFWLGLVLVGCHDAKHVEGEKIVASAGDHVVVGTVSIDVESRNDALVIRMHEGARNDMRYVTGNRVVKFGAHRVQFAENDESVLAADEAMSPRSSGPVDCTSATLSPDGASFLVQCRDTGFSDPGRVVKVDAVTGAILSI